MIDFFNKFFTETQLISVVDIGAACFNGVQARYSSLLNYQNVCVFGFEPNKNEYRNLLERFGNDYRYKFSPIAIGDGLDHQLNICRHPGCSSFLQPNFRQVEMFPAFAEWMEIVDSVPIKSRRLDDCHEIKKADFIKIDTQGTELLILQNAIEKLKGTLIIECEVEFFEQYIGQPRFSEIELFLRNNDFQFYCFRGYGSRMVKPFPVENNPLQPGSQWLWSDAVFMRDPRKWEELPDLDLIKLAIFFFHMYSANDFSFKALEILDKRNLSTLSDIFYNKIYSF